MVRAASTAAAGTPCEANLFEGSLSQAEKNAQNAQPLHLRCGNMNCEVRFGHPGWACGTLAALARFTLLALSAVEGSLPKGAQSKGRVRPERS